MADYDIPVNVVGDNTPDPIVDFPTSGLAIQLLENVLRAGYMVPTPVQKYGVPIIHSGPFSNRRVPICMRIRGSR
jgi:hypothetical protein